MSLPSFGQKKQLGAGTNIIISRSIRQSHMSGMYSTFDNAYSKLLSSLENGAQDHFVLADSLSSQVNEELKKLDRKHDDAKKKVS